MKKEITLLLVEDNPGDAFLVKEFLSESQDSHVNVHHVTDLENAVRALAQKQFDVALLDLGLPDSEGLAALEKIVETAPDVPVIVNTGMKDEKAGRTAVKMGAQSYILKDHIDAFSLCQTISHSLERHQQLKKIKANEEELREKNQQLTEANKTKDRLISIISHDLRSPIDSVDQLSKILLDEYEELDDNTRKRYIAAFYDNIHNTQGLIANLLDWARSQSGRHEPEPDLFLLNELAERTVQQVKPFAEKKEITLLRDVPDGLQVYADLEMMTIVLRNLLMNAVKFTPRNGQISVSAREENNGRISVSVTDNGVGIPEEIQPKLFDLGAGYSSPGTENEKGTGFGLTVCKEFVEKNKGHLHLSSQPDKGTTLTFSLPVE